MVAKRKATKVKAKTKAKAKAKKAPAKKKAVSKAKAKAKTSAKPKIKSRAKTPVKTKAEAKTKSKPKVKAKSKAKTQAKKVTAKKKTVIKPKTKAKSKPQKKASASSKKVTKKLTVKAKTSKAATKTTVKKKAKESKKEKVKKTPRPPTQKAPRPRSVSTEPTFSPYAAKRNEEYMNEEQKSHFSEILQQWKLQLMEEVDRTVNHMKDEAANYPDPADRASQEEEFSLELKTRDRERKLIRKIDNTLELIDQDDYGYCESCGIEIGVHRLEARPTATQCIDCKTLDEIKERQILG